MLGKPDAGWSRFEMGDVFCHLSYMTDVAGDWLEQAIYGLETMRPFAVHGTLEPGRMVCAVSYWNCHIIVESDGIVDRTRDDAEYETYNMSMLEFCRALHRDVTEDLEDWVRWIHYLGDDEEIERKIHAERREELQQLLDRLAELIREREESFGPHRFFF